MLALRAEQDIESYSFTLELSYLERN